MADTPPSKTVEMNSMEQTAAIIKLQHDVESIEQALLMIVAAAGPLGDLRDLIQPEKAEGVQESNPTPEEP